MEKVVTSLLALTAFFLLVLIFLTQTQITEKPAISLPIQKELPKPILVSPNITPQGVAIRVPAVDNEGNGVVTTLMVEAKPGEGRVLVDINQLLFWVDTQHSIRIAERVAENITKLNLSTVDLVYAIETNASLIEGGSAGAAITIATVAALQNKSLNQDVMITGTINRDGTIGPVGEIVAKAKASKDVGAKVFLVPLGQAVRTYYKPVQQCEKFGFATFCTTEYKPERIDVSKEVGIEVKEVKNIEEALKYFLV
jgi:uncharacterized protein